MQVMQALDICWETTAVLLANLDLVVTQSCSFGFGFGYYHTSV